MSSLLESFSLQLKSSSSLLGFSSSLQFASSVLNIFFLNLRRVIFIFPHTRDIIWIQHVFLELPMSMSMIISSPPCLRGETFRFVDLTTAENSAPSYRGKIGNKSGNPENLLIFVILSAYRVYIPNFHVTNMF